MSDIAPTLEEWTDLAELPVEHPLRNAPLSTIGAEQRWAQAKGNGEWKPVLPHWRIARCAFNELGPAWTAHTRWRCQLQPEHKAALAVSRAVAHCPVPEAA